MSKKQSKKKSPLKVGASSLGLADQGESFAQFAV